jgi:hypothetical protein
MQRLLWTFRAKKGASSRDLSILNIQGGSFIDEMERFESELGQTTYSEDLLSIPFFGNRGRGKCGAIPHNADPANAGRSPSSSTNLTLSHGHGSLVQPSRLTRCLAVPGKSPVVRPENSGYQSVEDDLLTRSK